MTLFPDMCNAFLHESIIGRAIAAGTVDVECTDIRPFTENKHGRTDDYPYGGGRGMVMSAQPIYDCYRAICEKRGDTPPVIYMSPKGKVLTQQKALELSKGDGFIILCGHYEGVDQRLIDEIVDEEISIGDYVLTGGEMPALVLTDAVCRMIGGVLSDDECFTEESHFRGFLNILNIPVLPYGEKEIFPRFCFRAIIKTLPRGAERKCLPKRRINAPICWKMRISPKRNAFF